MSFLTIVLHDAIFTDSRRTKRYDTINVTKALSAKEAFQSVRSLHSVSNHTQGLSNKIPVVHTEHGLRISHNDD